MMVVGYHTGGSYAREAALLERSLRFFSIPNFIEKFPSVENWDQGVSIKAPFIEYCRKRFRGPILYVDVDAVFHEDPSEYFDDLGCDFAAHWFQGPKFGYHRDRNDNHFLSGTMFFADTDPARNLLQTWKAYNRHLRTKGIHHGGGQANLRTVLDTFSIPGLKVARLPGRYCYVYDKSWAYPKTEPRIIEHLIASRENRGSSKGKIHEGRQKQIEELWKKFGNG